MLESSAVRLIAFHLPQYHPTPENDAWWGKGFTEWRNVVQARPRFAGHYQPHLPADLGFYDLRLPEARAAQAELARAYGVYGFCYYHYWFNGRRLLDRPVREILHSGRPDFPFCLCWANENWTRRWNGGANDVLMEQTYSEADDRQHLRFLADVFRDRRYIRIEGRPLFLVYKATELPDARRTTERWRDEARRQGVPDPYLCLVHRGAPDVDPRDRGFDAAVEFQPDFNALGPRLKVSWRDRLRGLVGLLPDGKAGYFAHDYETVVERGIARKDPPYLLFPCVTPGWDNCARRRTGAIILHRSTPALYEQWLRHAVAEACRRPPPERIVFLNAWNEWAEGNHLEPDLKFGHAYLEATRRALASGSQTRSHPGACGMAEESREVRVRSDELGQPARGSLPRTHPSSF